MNQIKYKFILEAKWGAFFNKLNWGFEYENSNNQLADWLPDFAINIENNIQSKILVEASKLPSFKILNKLVKDLITNYKSSNYTGSIYLFGSGFPAKKKSDILAWRVNCFQNIDDLDNQFDYQKFLVPCYLVSYILNGERVYDILDFDKFVIRNLKHDDNSITSVRVIELDELKNLWLNNLATNYLEKNIKNKKFNQPAIAKGTRDFLPSEVIKRNYIFDHIKEVFKTYAYLPIETPAIELLQTLTGKYGDEGDKLLFKILNNGDYIQGSSPEALANKDSNAMLSSISKRGLRYDLTVPLARYVSMHQNDIQFPFKRYAIQPVWRADRPQKGRYQEFYQCDADMVGSDSLMYEAELLQILDTVYKRLNIDVIIKLNNRKILQGIAEVAGQLDNFIGITVTIDKLDKIGREKVLEELINIGMDTQSANTILALIEIKEINAIATKLESSEIGMLGVSEMREVMDYMSDYQLNNKVEFDFTLARGLSYYTGCIIEVVADTASYPDLRMGSISGGGRYADLTSMFGLKDMSGVGVSFGAERIYDVMEECDLFPRSVTKSIDIFFVSFDDVSHRYAYKQVSALRAAGISADLYPEAAKMKKQMKYANGTGAPYVAIIGSEEVEAGAIAVKEMATGDQGNYTLSEIIEKLKA